MSRPPLPPEARRVQVRLTLSPHAEAELDALAVRTGGNRSALVEQLVLAEAEREERRRAREARRA